MFERRLVVGLVALVVLTGIIVVRGQTPQGCPGSLKDARKPGSELLFVADGDTANNMLCVVGTDGSAPRLIAAPEAGIASARWSPDGTRIAFSYRAGHDSAVYVMDSNGDNQGRIATSALPDFDMSPAWSPDGAVIAFDGDGGIAIANPDGSNLRTVASSVQGFRPVWSPDGERLLFTSVVGNGMSLYVVNRNGTELRQLVAGGVRSLPVWSPDGSLILFSSGDAGQHAIRVIAPDGSGQRQLTESNGQDNLGSWSPDGEWIAFTTTRDGRPRIYLMRADGSEQQPLPGAQGSVAQWSPDGEQIAYISGDWESCCLTLHVINRDGSNHRILTNSLANTTQPDWRPIRNMSSR
jgi:Tol biopolymer transport system component